MAKAMENALISAWMAWRECGASLYHESGGFMP